MEKRINESCTIRRQETNGQSEETGETRHAATVKDDVAIHEDITIHDGTHATSLVRAAAHAYYSRQHRGLSSLARPNTTPQRNTLVSPLLIPSWHNIQQIVRFRTWRRLTLCPNHTNEQEPQKGN